MWLVYATRWKSFFNILLGALDRLPRLTIRCRTMKIPYAFAALAAMSQAGCVGMTVGMTAPVVKIASEAFNAEADPDLARDASPGQIKTAEGFLAADPENRTLLGVVSRGYIEYTFGFLE